MIFREGFLELSLKHKSLLGSLSEIVFETSVLPISEGAHPRSKVFVQPLLHVFQRQKLLRSVLEVCLLKDASKKH